MKIYYLPKKIKALMFDMDLTLYSNAEYGQYQTDSLVERLGLLKGLSFENMKAEVEESRKAWALSHGGKKTSLSGILETYGINTEENVRWRKELFEPGKFLKEDKSLKLSLEKLSSNFVLGVVTNNPVEVAVKTLAALGLQEFSVIVGLDTCLLAKPHEKPFLRFCDLAGCPPEACVSIGDRYDIDLDIPLKLGMGGILVDGVEDVYLLPGLFLSLATE